MPNPFAEPQQISPVMPYPNPSPCQMSSECCGIAESCYGYSGCGEVCILGKQLFYSSNEAFRFHTIHSTYKILCRTITRLQHLIQDQYAIMFGNTIAQEGQSTKYKLFRNSKSIVKMSTYQLVEWFLRLQNGEAHQFRLEV